MSSTSPIPAVNRPEPAQRRADPSLMEPAVAAYLASGDLPDALTCPILKTLMRDPVSTPYATYERAAIERHFQRRGPETDPMTGALLPSAALMPNQAIKTLVGEFLDLLRARDLAAAYRLTRESENAARNARTGQVDVFAQDRVRPQAAAWAIAAPARAVPAQQLPAPARAAPAPVRAQPARHVPAASPAVPHVAPFAPRSMDVTRNYVLASDPAHGLDLHEESAAAARGHADELLRICASHAARGKAALRQPSGEVLATLAARDWLDVDLRLREFVSAYAGASHDQPTMSISELVRQWTGEIARRARQELEAMPRVEVAEAVRVAPDSVIAPVARPVDPSVFRAADRRSAGEPVAARASRPVASGVFRAADRRRGEGGGTPLGPRPSHAGMFRAADRRPAAVPTSRPVAAAAAAAPEVRVAVAPPPVPDVSPVMVATLRL